MTINSTKFLSCSVKSLVLTQSSCPVRNFFGVTDNTVLEINEISTHNYSNDRPACTLLRLSKKGLEKGSFRKIIKNDCVVLIL